ncbi:ferritin-like fold-containing protein [Rathayibacter sp. VKM Ac-2928]|uniref:ferritin-like fold-containing protein n=1 Tax=Rathayibacter sp. VKM Ac-2928 TaxID=2929479 RepID=UPI001FB52F42|nr:ferritin-like fold-containing protein [Rathayibacter sp. VKM Ac-2928]MCJ1685117.1 ferritin-like domain-containing protein [Rathayibacter sp. VKM Ac-2928]
MAAWFRRRRPLGEAPRLTPRGESTSKRDRVDLADLSPQLLPYLGQVAYLQLAVFEALARGVAGTDDLADKEAISAAAGTALAKHHAVVAELRRRDVEPSEAMAPFRPAIDTFEHLTRGADLHETLLSAYITAGLLDDFFIRLTGGLPNDVGPRMAQTLGADTGIDGLVAILRREIAADERLGSRLAVWGRRLVGDTLLVARSALMGSGNPDSDESRIEPVFTELIASHTRRMDALGLTA